MMKLVPKSLFLRGALIVILSLLTVTSYYSIKSKQEYKAYQQQSAMNKTYWQNELDKLPLGANQNTINQWLSLHELTSNPYNNKYSSTVAHYPLEYNLACNAYFTQIVIETNDNGKVIDKAIKFAGSCL